MNLRILLSIVLDTSDCTVVVAVFVDDSPWRERKVGTLFDPPITGCTLGITVKRGHAKSAGNLEIARKVTDRDWLKLRPSSAGGEERERDNVN